jgi:hypothetical protein
MVQCGPRKPAGPPAVLAKPARFQGRPRPGNQIRGGGKKKQEVETVVCPRFPLVLIWCSTVAFGRISVYISCAIIYI